MNIVSAGEPEFYTAYTNARVIIDRKGLRRATNPDGEILGMLSGTLTNAVTAEPIADSIVQLQGVAEATTTDEDGTFAFRPGYTRHPYPALHKGNLCQP